ncbi:MAG: NTP transferase domain-containing protein [Paracoccaceae bacterium]
MRPSVEVVLLAAGASRRMRGRDKLLEEIDGEPQLRRAAKAALGSQADRVVVVLPPENPPRRAALRGLAVDIVESADWRAGLSASIRTGVAAVSAECDAVVVALADMPEIAQGHYDRLMAAFDPAENREICRAVAGDGTRGHPVLFGRRFFESLARLHGDRGARDILADAGEFIVDVATDGPGAAVDLDTPEAWAGWRRQRLAKAESDGEN